MSSHRAEWTAHPGRLRALLGLGVLLALGTSGTYAHWTDEVAIGGTSLTSATLDLNVNGGDPATTTLSMTAMVPGSSKAQVLPVNNVGTAPAKYSMAGGLTGAGASAYSTAGVNGLLLSIRSGGTSDGTSCGGGTLLVDNQPLTATASTPILTRRPGTALAPLVGTENLCFQIKLAVSAPSALQGAVATASFTVTGTSDVS